MWFILERLEPLPLEILNEAGDSLIQVLRELAPDATITTMLLTNCRTHVSPSP